MGCTESKRVDVRKTPSVQQLDPANVPQLMSSEEKAVQLAPRVEPLQGVGGFVPVGENGGALCLSHFPGRKTLTWLKENGCDMVVTLQSDKEGALDVKRNSKTFRMDWHHIDFWQLYHRKMANELHCHVATIASHIMSGKKVMVHCAAGIHRTGMFAYAILRELDFTPEAASASLHCLRDVTYTRVGRHRVMGVEELLGTLFPFAVALRGDEDFLPPPMVKKTESPSHGKATAA